MTHTKLACCLAAVLSLVLALPAIPSAADTVILDSGAQLTAPILAQCPTGVVRDLGHSVLMIPRENILAVETQAAYDPNEPDPQEGIPATHTLQRT